MPGGIIMYNTHFGTIIAFRFMHDCLYLMMRFMLMC